jgi:hypothetical protein
VAASRLRENDNTETPDLPERQIEEAFDRLVEEGEAASSGRPSRC